MKQNYNDPRLPDSPTESDGMVQYQEKQKLQPMLAFRGYKGMAQQSAYDAANEAIQKTAVARYNKQSKVGSNTYNTSEIRVKRLFAGGN